MKSYSKVPVRYNSCRPEVNFSVRFFAGMTGCFCSMRFSPKLFIASFQILSKIPYIIYKQFFKLFYDIPDIYINSYNTGLRKTMDNNEKIR